MFSLVFILRVTFHGIGGWNDTENVIDGSWNRFITVNNPWNGPIAFGPGETKLKARNLCPGLDGRTDHDCRVNITANWIRMVQLAGNGNGGTAVTTATAVGLAVPTAMATAIACMLLC